MDGINQGCAPVLCGYGVTIQSECYGVFRRSPNSNTDPTIATVAFAIFCCIISPFDRIVVALCNFECILLLRNKVHIDSILLNTCVDIYWHIISFNEFLKKNDVFCFDLR